MGELKLLGAGLLVVALDLRLNGVDFLTDVVGWVMAIVALLSLAKLHGGFLVAAFAAGVGLVAWAANPWLGVDQDVAATAETVAQTVLVFASCTALMALVPQQRRTADQIRWWDLGLALLATALGWALEGTDDGAAFLVLLLIVPVLGVYIWFLVLLFRCANEEPAAASA